MHKLLHTCLQRALLGKISLRHILKLAKFTKKSRKCWKHEEKTMMKWRNRLKKTWETMVKWRNGLKRRWQAMLTWRRKAMMTWRNGLKDGENMMKGLNTDEQQWRNDTTGWKDDEMKRLAENMMKSHVKHRSGSKRWWNQSPRRQKEIGWKIGENQWYINLTIGCKRRKSWRAHVVLFNQRAVYLHCGRAIQKIGKEWIAFANGKIGKKSVLETKQLKGTCNVFQSSTCSLPVF